MYSGLYSVTITDGEGCLVIGSIQAEGVDPCLDFNLSTSLVGGEIFTTLSGGTTPYLYEWSNGATTESITVTDNGIYTIEVTDSFGCFVSDTISVDSIGLPCDDFLVLRCKE